MPVSEVGGSVRGAVAAGSPAATEAAADVLRRGGSAVDAAVAAAAVQCVAEFPWGGIGGDAFVLVREPTGRADRHQSHPAPGLHDLSGRVVALNGSGAAPFGLEAAVEPGSKVPRFGSTSVAVPGFADAVCQAHARYGILSLTDLFTPAAERARTGVELTGELGRASEKIVSDLEASSPLRGYLEAALARPDRTLALPVLADTLTDVATNGPDVFYRGRLAKAMAAHLQSRGGVLDLDDMAAHSSQWVEPITASYRNTAIAVHPPVSLGCIALLELRLYERLGMEAADLGDHLLLTSATSTRHRGLDATDPGDPERIDAMVRCKHAALADALAVLGDDPSAAKRAEYLLSDEHVEARVQSLLETPPEELTRPFDGADTTCVAVVDGRGQQAVIIHSLFNEFGSRELDPTTGVLLNDRLGNQTVGAGPGRVSGGRRPLHTLHAFSMESDGTAVMGATPGGRGQFQTNFQVIANLVDGGMGLQAAINAPRWLSGAPRRPGADLRLHLEPALGLETAQQLRDRGHDAVLTDPDDVELFGSMTAVGLAADGSPFAAADRRREATAAIL